MKMKDALKLNDDFRDAARPAGGSLGATMGQGGSHSHESADSLPPLMNQGSSTKHGSMLKSVPLRRKMGQ